MDDLIAYLRSKTHLGRFTEPEIRELIARMNEDGWEIVRKADGAIVEPESAPILNAEIETNTNGGVKVEAEGP